MPTLGRCQRWVEDGTLSKILSTLAQDLYDRGKIDVEECFIDGTFASAKKGCGVGKTQAGQGFEAHGGGEQHGSSYRHECRCGSPHEVTLVETTLAAGFISDPPRRLIADRVYDSDPLDKRLSEKGMELIAPHKRNRSKAATQDGRVLRRYKRK
ncbi:MAG: transposase [Gammaproteobacteria bacterium]|nr:transposase [Gammaproteobacteria bacterium]